MDSLCLLTVRGIEERAPESKDRVNDITVTGNNSLLFTVIYCFAVSEQAYKMNA